MDLVDLLKLLREVVIRSKSKKYEVYISMDLLPTPYTSKTLELLVSAVNGFPVYYSGEIIGRITIIDSFTQKGYNEYVSTVHNKHSFYRTQD